VHRAPDTRQHLEAQIPTGSKGGILFGFTAQTLLELGIDLGFDDVVADLMCEELFFGVVGDAEDYMRFKKAYDEGTDFRSIPQGKAAAGPLAVQVMRTCDNNVAPGAKQVASYSAPSGADLGAFDPVFGGFAYHLPRVVAGLDGRTSTVHMLNAGLECATIELWFVDQANCGQARICDTLKLAPGESQAFDAADCVGPGWQGGAWVRSTMPLAVVVDTFGAGTMDSAAVPAPARDLIAPLVYNDYQGAGGNPAQPRPQTRWQTRLHVQNVDPAAPAKVKLTALDRAGDAITTVVADICPRGIKAFDLRELTLPGNWLGSLRVESQEQAVPGVPSVVADIAAVVEVFQVAPDGAVIDRASYAAARTIGDAPPAWSQGRAVVALPAIRKGLAPNEATTEIAIANTVDKPGFTDVAVSIYDQNGLLDIVCLKLSHLSMTYIDLRTWGILNAGFKGSAIASASFWEHDVFDAAGNHVANLVGLAAVAVDSTRGVSAAAGDTTTAVEGIGYTLADDPAINRTRFLGACPSGPAVPTRPIPTSVVQPTATPLGRPTATPGRQPTAFPSPMITPRPTATAVPPTAPPATPAQPTATPAIAVRVCELIRSRVPAAEIAAALASPSTTGGFNQLENPSLPESPFNQRRRSLSIQSASRPWNRMFNPLVFKVGCP